MKRAWKTCLSCSKQFRGSMAQLCCTSCDRPMTRKGVLYGEHLPAAKQWMERHEVMSSDLNRTYIVARHADGHWACSCPRWKFKRETCKHIMHVQNKLAGVTT